MTNVIAARVQRTTIMCTADDGTAVAVRRVARTGRRAGVYAVRVMPAGVPSRHYTGTRPFVKMLLRGGLRVMGRVAA